MIITVTLNPAVDKTFAVERVIPERKLGASNVRRYPGGGGINVARAVSRLGGEVRALWTSSNGPGGILADLLDAENVDHRPLTIRDGVRENLVVKDVSSNQHYRFNMPGPELTRQECDDWITHLRQHAAGTRFTVFSGSLPRGVSVDWFRELIRAVPGHSRVIVDSKQKALAAALETEVYLIKPNIHELEEIIGRELGDNQQIEAAGRQLIEQRGAEIVLVSLGRGGAILITAQGAMCLPAPAVPKRSKVGAGDSMVGGVVTALARGEPLLEAARFGIAAGAAAVMREGTELCRRQDTERLFAQTREPEPVA